jgi:hypothetical protein
MTKHGPLPKRRADDCRYEFQSLDHAFKTQIRPHIDLEMARRVFDMAWFPEASFAIASGRPSNEHAGSEVLSKTADRAP